tara:strand:+ start:607 stop:789 length:183 start_codon:yes stop_codon:yes gene_type:complete
MPKVISPTCVTEGTEHNEHKLSLEDVVMEYVERYGLTEKARDYFRQQSEEDGNQLTGDRS